MHNKKITLAQIAFGLGIGGWLAANGANASPFGGRDTNRSTYVCDSIEQDSRANSLRTRVYGRRAEQDVEEAPESLRDAPTGAPPLPPPDIAALRWKETIAALTALRLFDRSRYDGCLTERSMHAIEHNYDISLSRRGAQ